MDLLHLENWLMTSYRTPKRRRPLRPATVDDTLRKMRHLAKCGVDWRRFERGPRIAQRLVAPILALKARNEDRPTGERDYQKVLNRVAVYLAHHRKAWSKKFRGDTWPLAPAVHGYGPRQEVAEVMALEGFQGRTEYETRLGQLVIWATRAVRLRRREIAGLRLSRFRPDYLAPGQGAYLHHRPGKGGHVRAIPLPPDTWTPGSPFMRFLEVRRADRSAPDVLCTRRDGHKYRIL